MANESKINLIKLIEEQYINIMYTREAHLKCSQRLEKQAGCLNILQIILSAVSTVGLISVFIKDNKIGTIAGTVCSTLLFVISTYIKDKDISSNSKNHINTAEKLFILREKYKMLLATCEDKTSQEIESVMQQFIENTEQIYQTALPFQTKDYEVASVAIKDGKLSISENDRKLLLPKFGENNDLE